MNTCTLHFSHPIWRCENLGHDDHVQIDDVWHDLWRYLLFTISILKLLRCLLLFDACIQHASWNLLVHLYNTLEVLPTCSTISLDSPPFSLPKFNVLIDQWIVYVGHTWPHIFLIGYPHLSGKWQCFYSYMDLRKTRVW